MGNILDALFCLDYFWTCDWLS